MLALRFRLTNPNEELLSSYRFLRVVRQSYLFNKELYVRNTMPDKIAVSVDMSHLFSGMLLELHKLVRRSRGKQ